MNLITTNQYNQGIGKNKLLSSNAGVGSIVTTKMGYYILVSDIDKWDFVHEAQKIVREIRDEEIDNFTRYEKSKLRIPKRGIDFIDDKRFVEFLKIEKDIPNLVCLIAIPSLSLNEQFNSPNWTNHPINKLLEGKLKAENFMVKGTHFPKWFKNDAGKLKRYSEWKHQWHQSQLKAEYFVPPRDSLSPILNSQGKQIERQIKDQDGVGSFVKLYKELSQINLILICPNGHLSDIPWPKYLKFKSEKREKGNDGADLFSIDNCCPTPDLLWTESKTKSDGYGSIYIECKSCGCGNGKDGAPKVNLEGITNLSPVCIGQKPWEIALEADSNTIPVEDCYHLGDKSNGAERLQLALVTGNNVYYANSFSSLYIPQHLAENKSKELIEGTTKCIERFEKFIKVKPEMTRQQFWDQKVNREDFLIENGIEVANEEEYFNSLKSEFLKINNDDEDIDRYEKYRWQEYQCFSSNKLLDVEGLKFADIDLPTNLVQYFDKIQQVEELQLTNVQLDFARVRPKQRVRTSSGEIIESAIGKEIFSIDKQQLFVLPANKSLGEGLFFKFNESQIITWEKQNEKVLVQRFNSFVKEIDPNSQGGGLKQKIKNYLFKHYLIHSFSHVLMRELEFSCGYPTASLKERLYVSDRMSGVLVYTAEGSEGSMGGLVWQGQADKISQLILKGLNRSVDCSSDPLCWESEGQGVFDLNYSACFSCSLTSETACEEMNLGLDRRVLIDSDFGFFKNLI